jgi:hypothetical protein
MTLKSSKLYGNDSTTEKPVRWGTNLNNKEKHAVQTLSEPVQRMFS